MTREYYFRSKYNLTEEQADKLTTLPCGLCGTLQEKRVIDHDHKTAKVRGPLCNPCNIALGRLEVLGWDWCKRAFLYVDFHRFDS